MSGKRLGSYTVAESEVAAVTFAPGGTTAAFGNVRGTVFLVDPKTGREVRRLSGRPGQGWTQGGRTLTADS